MYTPSYFAASPEQAAELLSGLRAADLVTATEDGLAATFLPLLFDPERGEHGALLGHLARTNDQWRRPAIGEALVIVRGVEGYVSPSWYATKAEHGRVVPTWNYVAAHVHGELIVHDDPAWVAGIVARLTDRQEAGREHPWSVQDAPAAYVAGQLRAVVGVEVRITRVEAKAKLSQNRSAADIDGVIEGAARDGAQAHADAVGAARPADKR